MVWYLIFHRSFGLNAHIMRFFGQPGIKLLEDSQYALLAIIVLSIWKSMGYYMVLFLAGHLGLDKPGTIAFCFSNQDEDRTVATLPPLEPYKGWQKDHLCAAFLDWRFGSPFCWTIADPF